MVSVQFILFHFSLDQSGSHLQAPEFGSCKIVSISNSRGSLKSLKIEYFNKIIYSLITEEGHISTET